MAIEKKNSLGSWSKKTIDDTKRGVKTLACHIWSFKNVPRELDGNKTFLYFIGLGGLYYYDEDINRHVLEHQDDRYLRDVKSFGNDIRDYGLMKKTNPYYVATFLMGYFSGREKMFNLSRDILESHALSVYFKTLVRISVGRYRPDQGKGGRFFKFNTGVSFFSGHTSTVFQDAAIFSYHFPYWPCKTLFYSFACVMAYQRLQSGAHWASDVFTGALYGTFFARRILRLNYGEKSPLTLRVFPRNRLLCYGVSYEF